MRKAGRNELKMLTAAIVGAWVLLVVIGAARAEGDGLPVVGVDTTHEGVLSSDGTQRFLAIPGGDGTQLLRLDAADGVMQMSRRVPGEFVVPGVTVDGDTDGLSADGGTLVLIRPRRTFPQASVSLLVVDPETLRARREIRLDGDFSFDAISPDGRMAYLTEYVNPRNPGDYRLRRLELPEGRLLPGSLLPENDPEEEMRGLPVSRATGSGARWQYTLYDGAGKEPFVHALDTVEERTLCIDLDWVKPMAVNRLDLQMSDDGTEVEVVDPRSGVIGRIDTASGEARQVSEPFAAADPAPAEEGGGGGAGDAVAIAGAALLLGGACLPLIAWRRRSRR
jgi:hypothetical protein